MFVEIKKDGEALARAKVDPFELQALIAWLAEKNPSEQYCFLDNGGCLFAQYFTAQGLENVRLGGWHVWHGKYYHEHETPLPLDWDDIAAALPHTFGAALKRARALAV